MIVKTMYKLAPRFVLILVQLHLGEHRTVAIKAGVIAINPWMTKCLHLEMRYG